MLLFFLIQYFQYYLYFYLITTKTSTLVVTFVAEGKQTLTWKQSRQRVWWLPVFIFNRL